MGLNFFDGQYTMAGFIVNAYRKEKDFGLRMKLQAPFDALQMFVPDVHTFNPSGNIGIVAQRTAIPIAVLDECNIHVR